MSKRFFILLLLMGSLFLWNHCQSVPLPKIIMPQDTLTAEEHNDLGVVYEEKKEYDLAEKEYKFAIEKNKQWFLPYFNLGNLYYKTKSYDLAEIYYKQSIQYNDKYGDAYNNLAYLLYEQKKYKEAEFYIKQALNIEDKDEYQDTYKKIEQALK